MFSSRYFPMRQLPIDEARNVRALRIGLLICVTQPRTDTMNFYQKVIFKDVRKSGNKACARKRQCAFFWNCHEIKRGTLVEEEPRAWRDERRQKSCAANSCELICLFNQEIQPIRPLRKETLQFARRGSVRAQLRHVNLKEHYRPSALYELSTANQQV